MPIGPLTDIFNSLGARLPEEWAQHVGEDQLDADATPPCLVWVPTTEPIVYFVSAQGPSRNNNPRTLGQRQSQVLAYLQGESLDAIDCRGGMLETLVAAIHYEAQGQFIYQLVSGKWLTAVGDTPLASGALYALTVQFSIPIVLPDEQTVTLDAIPITPNVDNG